MILSDVVIVDKSFVLIFACKEVTEILSHKISTYSIMLYYV